MEQFQIGIAAGRGETSNVLPPKAESNPVRMGRGQGDKLRASGKARQTWQGILSPYDG